MPRLLQETIRAQLGEDPVLLDYFDRHLVACGEATLRQLQEEADESAFPLRQWVQALALLQSWLAARRLRARLGDQIGYLGCVGAVAGASVGGHSLPPLVEDFLADYGFERAVPAEEALRSETPGD